MDLKAAQHQGLALHARIPASRWCVTQKDLSDFEVEVRNWHHTGRIPQSSSYLDSLDDDLEQGPSMYQVTEHFIKPVTLDAGGMSYALMLHPEGLECDVFVTHAWAEGVYEFCAKVRRAWPRRAKNLWCCFLANPQNGDLGELWDRDVHQSPFAVALHSASHMIAVPNRVVSIYSRLWCVYEAKLAMDLEVNITLPSASMRSVGYSMLVAVDSGLFSFSLVLLIVFFGGSLGYSMSGIASFSTGSAIMLASCAIRCITRVPTKKLAADMLVIGALLALMYVLWVKLHKILKPLNCFMEPKQLALLQKSHLFENLLRAAVSCATALAFERVFEQAREAALSQEADLIEFSSVRDAGCFNDEDATAIRSATKGKEDEIDKMIKVLQTAGAYNSAVRADLEMGIDPSYGRRIRPVRAVVVCILWAVCFQANMANAQPATPFGYWTFYRPWTSFLIVGIAPAAVALFVVQDSIYRRRAQYVVTIMWRGILIVILCHCLLTAASSFPHLADFLEYSIARSVHSMCWSYCVVFGLSAFCAILGPRCMLLIQHVLQSRCYFTLFMFCIVPFIWPSILHTFLCTFEQCVSQSGLLKDQVWLCTKTWTMHFATSSLGLMFYATFLARRLKHFDMSYTFKEPSGGCVEAEMVNVKLQRTASVLEDIVLARERSAEMRAGSEQQRILTKVVQMAWVAPRQKGMHIISWICVLLAISIISVLLPDHASRQEGVMTCPGAVDSVAFTRDGKYMVAASHSHNATNNTWLSFWEMKTGWETKRLLITHGTDWVSSVACSPDGHQVLTGFPNGTAKLWNAHTGEKLREFQVWEAGVTSAVFSPDGQHILTGSQDGTARLWLVSTGVEFMKFEGRDDAATSVAFSLDGAQVLVGSSSEIVRIWEASTGDMLRRFEWSVFDVTCVAFSPDGHRVLSGFEHGTARVFETRTSKEIQRFSGHNAAVTSVAFSGDGHQIVMGFEDGIAQLWQVDSGRELKKFQAHDVAVASIAFGPDEQRVLTGSVDKSARLWHARTGRELKRFQGHADTVTSVAFSPDGQQILTGSSDYTAKLWEASSGEELQDFQGHKAQVNSVAFSPDGKKLLTSSKDGTALLWARTGKKLRQFHTHHAAVTAVAFSEDGNEFLVGSRHGIAQMLDTRTGKMLQTYQGHTSAIHAIAFSSSGLFVFTGSSDGTARLWAAETGKELKNITFMEMGINLMSVAFNARGARVLTVSVHDIATLWDSRTGKAISRFHLGYHAVVTGHSGFVTSVAISPDAHQVLTGSKDGTARLWEARTGTILLLDMRHVDPVSSIAFSPDGSYVVTGSLDRTARLWEASSGKVLTVFSGHSGPVFSVAVSPDGEQVLTGSRDCTARLWDKRTGKQLKAIHVGHFVYAVAFSPNGKQLLTASVATAAMWDARTGRELREFGVGRVPKPRSRFRPIRICVFQDPTGKSPTSIAVSADGQRVLVGSKDNTATLWQTQTGDVLQYFQGHDAAVTSVAVSPDALQVLTGSEDGTARLWQARTGEVLMQFVGHKAEVNSVAFSPDGQRVLTGSNDETAKLWDASTGKQLREFDGQNAEVTSVAFSPDGQLALLASDITAKSWTVASGSLFHEYGLPCRYWLSK